MRIAVITSENLCIIDRNDAGLTCAVLDHTGFRPTSLERAETFIGLLGYKATGAWVRDLDGNMTMPVSC